MVSYPQNETEFFTAVRSIIATDSLTDEEIRGFAHEYLNKKFLRETDANVSGTRFTVTIPNGTTGTNVVDLDRTIYTVSKSQPPIFIDGERHLLIQSDILGANYYSLRAGSWKGVYINTVDDINAVLTTTAGDRLYFQKFIEATEDIVFEIYARASPIPINANLDPLFQRKGLITLLTYGTAVEIATKRSLTEETKVRESYEMELQNHTIDSFPTDLQRDL